jgi:hypothetical protein
MIDGEGEMRVELLAHLRFERRLGPWPEAKPAGAVPGKIVSIGH